jgi:hypothetical protein
MILSVGYRVKNKTATQFRIWATDRLRDYLVKGYAISQQRLDQIGRVVRILPRSSDELVCGCCRRPFDVSAQPETVA